ncbi:unnamed protein product, partial [Heterosigma akashiwo]
SFFGPARPAEGGGGGARWGRRRRHCRVPRRRGRRVCYGHGVRPRGRRLGVRGVGRAHAEGAVPPQAAAAGAPRLPLAVRPGGGAGGHCWAPGGSGDGAAAAAAGGGGGGERVGGGGSGAGPVTWGAAAGLGRCWVQQRART